jgi:KDO2-lipid IV(A) lauroyltransferase
MPTNLAYAIARKVGALRYARRRGSMEPNPKLAVRGTADQIAAWLKTSSELMVCEDLENHLFSRIDKNNIRDLIEVRGLENLDAALSKGKGAILYSGHVRGHFTFFAALGLLGYPVNIIGRHLSRGAYWLDGKFQDRRVANLCERTGCRFLWAQASNFGVAAKAYRALKSNQVAAIEIDKALFTETVQVDFLGGKEAFPTGHAILAQTSGAPLLDFFIHRTHGQGPQIAEIGTPYYVGQDIHSATQHCAARLEESILRFPAQWNHVCFPRWGIWKPKG